MLGAIGGATGVLFLLGAVPMSRWPTASPAPVVAAISIVVWSAMVTLTGAVQNAFQLFLARLGSGLGHSTALPVTDRS